MSEGLRAGSRLNKEQHMQWKRLKMKGCILPRISKQFHPKVLFQVHLATQTLSRSVTDALHWLGEDLKLEEFADSALTTEFIWVLDQLFDHLNSRSKFWWPAKGTTQKGE